VASGDDADMRPLWDSAYIRWHWSSTLGDLIAPISGDDRRKDRRAET